MATVQVAVFEAVNAISGKYEPYPRNHRCDPRHLAGGSAIYSGPWRLKALGSADWRIRPLVEVSRQIHQRGALPGPVSHALRLDERANPRIGAVCAEGRERLEAGGSAARSPKGSGCPRTRTRSSPSAIRGPDCSTSGPCREIWERGLEVRLGAYGSHVFWEFREVMDGVAGQWARLGIATRGSRASPRSTTRSARSSSSRSTSRSARCSRTA